MEEQKKGIADVQEELPAETMADYQKELEASFRTINEGDVISGTVIDVNETGVTLDLGYYAPGVIKAEDLSRDPGFSILADVHIGDILEGTVVKKTTAREISRSPAWKRRRRWAGTGFWHIRKKKRYLR